MTIGEREYERHRQTTPNGKLAESYFDLGGVRGPVCEVIDAMAEDNDRLRRELEEAREVTRKWRNRYEVANGYYVGSLLQIARMRPVVEAVGDVHPEDIVRNVNLNLAELPLEDWDNIAEATRSYRDGAGKGGE